MSSEENFAINECQFKAHEKTQVIGNIYSWMQMKKREKQISDCVLVVFKNVYLMLI